MAIISFSWRKTHSSTRVTTTKKRKHTLNAKIKPEKDEKMECHQMLPRKKIVEHHPHSTLSQAQQQKAGFFRA